VNYNLSIVSCIGVVFTQITSCDCNQFLLVLVFLRDLHLGKVISLFKTSVLNHEAFQPRLCFADLSVFFVSLYTSNKPYYRLITLQVVCFDYVPYNYVKVDLV